MLLLKLKFIIANMFTERILLLHAQNWEMYALKHIS